MSTTEGGRITLPEMIRRATGGRTPNLRTIFRPSSVYALLYDPFWIWCGYHAPREAAVDETTRYDEMKLQRGVDYERAWMQKNFPAAVRIRPAFGFEALQNTCKAMLAGIDAIYGPQLWDLDREMYGKSDLLVRDNSRGSDLGPYHYRLVEIKNAWTLRDYHILQAACYHTMLGRIQGYTPPELTVALKKTSENVPYADREKTLEDLLARWRAVRAGQIVPEPSGKPPRVTGSPWRIYANRLVQERWDLILLPGIGPKDREKLREAGIARLDQLWDRRLDEVCAILGEQSGSGVYHVAQAYRTGLPILKPGARLDVPRARRHLYFDFETSDDVHPTQPPHVYLIGCWDAEQEKFAHFLARGAGDEGRIFKEFLDHVGDPRDARLYHWTDFEVEEIRGVIRRWPALEGPLTKLIASCVDLKEVIKSAVYLPVPSFSLKSVAPALGFQWRQDDVGAFESMVLYWEYLDGVEPKASHMNDAAIQKALIYNEDDCLAMRWVDEDLRRRCG